MTVIKDGIENLWLHCGCGPWEQLKGDLYHFSSTSRAWTRVIRLKTASGSHLESMWGHSCVVFQGNVTADVAHIPMPNASSVPTSTTAIVFGGRSQGGILSSTTHILRLPTSGMPSWLPAQLKARNRQPPARAYAAACAGGQGATKGGGGGIVMFLHGGMGSGRRLSDLWALHFDGEFEWQQVDAQGVPPSARHGHQMAMLDSSIILFGGWCDDGCSSELFALHMTTWPPTWERLRVFGATVSPRWGSTLTLMGQSLYLVGGRTANGKLLGDISKLTRDGEMWKWTVLASSDFVPRSEHCAVCINGALWVIGGYSGCRLALDVLDVFSEEAGKEEERRGEEIEDDDLDEREEGKEEAEIEEIDKEGTDKEEIDKEEIEGKIDLTDQKSQTIESAELSDSAASIAKMNVNVERIASQLPRARAEVERLAGETGMLMGRLEVSEEELMRARARIAHATAALNHSEQQVVLLQEQRNQLELRCAYLEEENARLRQQCFQLPTPVSPPPPPSPPSPQQPPPPAVQPEWLEPFKVRAADLGRCYSCSKNKCEYVLFPCHHIVLCGLCSSLFAKCPLPACRVLAEHRQKIVVV